MPFSGSASVAAEADRAPARKDLWCGHQVRVVDGTTLTLPDTPENQKRHPQQSVQHPGCGFPILRLTGLFSLATGLFTAWATGAWQDHELQLLSQLWEHCDPDDVLLGDPPFPCPTKVIDPPPFEPTPVHRHT